jgi:hypothetical protein
MAIPSKPSLLIKTTLDTKFSIDYEWWERGGDDLQVYLLSHISPEQHESLRQMDMATVVDYVDPETAEVFQLDALKIAIKRAADTPGFVSSTSSLVDSIFRVFLKNNNTPLSARELSDITGRRALTIMKTLGGIKVYKGLRPIIS